MHALIKRSCALVDSSGAGPRRAAFAVSGEHIAAVGTALGSAKRKIDAEGVLVAPGFVNVHTHCDGQATWDPFFTPSSTASSRRIIIYASR